MEQWGFYFNQDRCVGCKTCVMACKNWNDGRRGDAAVNVDSDRVQASPGELEKTSNFIDAASGAANYEQFRKYHMKEDWRRVQTHESGEVVVRPDNSFESTFDRRYLSVACNHCDHPPCAEVCPQGIIYKEETFGAVLVDQTACISCGQCKAACPWDAPQFYDPRFGSFDTDDPKRPRMTKCTLCLDRIAEGLKPACVAACWNRALDAGPMDELRQKYRMNHERTLPEFESDYIPSLKINTGPNIIFKRKAVVT